MFHVTIRYFQKETFNMWITSGSYVGHIWIILWVSRSNGSTCATHFNLDNLSHINQGQKPTVILCDHANSTDHVYTYIHTYIMNSSLLTYAS